MLCSRGEKEHLGRYRRRKKCRGNEIGAAVEGQVVFRPSDEDIRGGGTRNKATKKRGDLGVAKTLAELKVTPTPPTKDLQNHPEEEEGTEKRVGVATEACVGHPCTTGKGQLVPDVQQGQSTKTETSQKTAFKRSSHTIKCWKEKFLPGGCPSDTKKIEAGGTTHQGGGKKPGKHLLGF